MLVDTTPADRRTAAVPLGAGHGLRHPLNERRRIRGVLFDLDGTLYRQTPLRSFMALELLTLPLAGPFRAPRRWRALESYRSAQERLRRTASDGSIAAAQLAAAAAESNLPQPEVKRLVDEWIQTRPLKYLRLCRAPGVLEVLALLDAAGVPAGVLSDYPAHAKITALGLAGRFSIVLCSSDSEVGALKPHPRGFLRACQQWQLDPRDVLMVGDRVDVDAAGASAAGMPCVIIGRGRPSPAGTLDYLTVPSLERLCDVLDDRR